MKIVVSQSKDSFEIQPVVLEDPVLVVKYIRGQLEAARAVWPDKLKGVKLTGRAGK